MGFALVSRLRFDVTVDGQPSETPFEWAESTSERTPGHRAWPVGHALDPQAMGQRFMAALSRVRASRSAEVGFWF